MAGVNEFTHLLNAVAEGDAKARAGLLPTLYNELRRLAQRKMADEKAGHTLQATALVHEAWIRLVGSGQGQWKNRGHFFSAAAEAMRRILIDQARRRNSLKRGGGEVVEELNESRIEMHAPSDELLAVHDALDALATEDATSAEIVKLRYFAGCSVPEIAEMLGVSPSTVDRHWAFARAWLKCALRNESATRDVPLG